MKSLLRNSAAYRLRIIGRWYVALPLFALLLSSIGVAGLAQRRTAIRVGAGGAEKSVAAPLKKGRAKQQDRAKQSRGIQPIGQKDGGLPYTPVSQDTETVGVPSVGEVGIQKTTAEIMSDQANVPKVSSRPLLIPELKGPDRRLLPQDPNAQAVASTPGRRRGLRVPPSQTTSAPQTVSTPNFLGATLADTGAFPPDSMGAVGPTQYVVFLNGRVRTFNKTTGVADGVVNADSDVFFATVMTPVSGGSLNINFTSDPRVRYDRRSRRWVLIIIDVPSVNTIGDTPNRLLIAVSDSASNGVLSGSTVWTFFFVQQDTVGPIPSTGEFLDYPTLGIDEDALYVGGNMFGAVSGSFVNCTGFVIRKSSILGGGPVVTTAFRGILPNGASDGPFTPQGVDNYATGTNEGYFIGVSNAFFGRLNFRRVTNPDTTPTISPDLQLTVAATSFPITVDHLGDTGGAGGNLDALDDRLFAAHMRGGRLWTAHNMAVTSAGVASNSDAQRRNGVRWYELNGIRSADNGGVPIVIQSGTIFDTAATVALARQFWIPSVMVSGQGHSALGFSTAGTPFRADAATNGRLRGDTLGTTGAFALYTASSTAYNPPGDPGPTRRWGDYSMVSLDPKDDMTMWTIQEFTNATNSYGVQVVRLLAPLPVTPTNAGPNNVASGQSSVNVIITGTSVGGTEFYDPGPDIPGAEPFTHISATVSGGVTVNSVTFNSTTQVTLNISTVGTPAGAKNVTITNPDDQSATGVGILTVAAPSTTPLIISELRVRGPSGANDEFIEIYNQSGASHTVADSGVGTGYGIVASDGLTRCVIPNGTVIPSRGHFLCVGSAYSLAGSAAGDANFGLDIPDNAGVAIFNTSIPLNFILGNRFDAVGSTSEANPLFKEGAGYPAITPFLIDYSFTRTLCPGNTAIFGSALGCASGGTGLPKDTDANQNDFIFVDTNGTSAGAGQRLGAPGPENLASPIQRNSVFGFLLLDATLGGGSPPNRVRDFTSDPPNNSTFGTIDVRRRVVNNTGASVTRLRFRVTDINTFPAPAGFADLRTRTSTLVVVSGVNDAATCLASTGSSTTPCTINVQGTTLEQPPSQPNGGAFNSTYSAGTVTLGTPLANGASINVRFLLGIQQTGNFRFFINVEALP